MGTSSSSRRTTNAGVTTPPRSTARGESSSRVSSSVATVRRTASPRAEPGRDGQEAAPGVDLDAAREQAAVTRLIDAYREIGHYLADLDPLKLNPSRDSHELLDLAAFGLSEADLDKTFYNRLTDPPYATLRELIAILRETYCRTIGVEYMHIRNIAGPQVAPGADGAEPEPAQVRPAARSGGSS